MGKTTGFTRRLHFCQQSYVLCASFNEAGELAHIDLDVEPPALKIARSAAKAIAGDIRRLFISGIPQEQIAAHFKLSGKSQPVRGYDGVCSASNPTDMIIQVLMKEAQLSQNVQPKPQKFGHLALVSSR